MPAYSGILKALPHLEADLRLEILGLPKALSVRISNLQKFRNGSDAKSFRPLLPRCWSPLLYDTCNGCTHFSCRRIRELFRGESSALTGRKMPRMPWGKRARSWLEIDLARACAQRWRQRPGCDCETAERKPPDQGCESQGAYQNAP